MQPVENPSWKNPFDTCKREVEAAVVTARYDDVANVVDAYVPAKYVVVDCVEVERLNV